MGVKHEVYTIVNSEGLKLYCQKWEPDCPFKALVCVVHGYGEHLDNYLELVGLLNKQGCVVFGHDHVGHGRSEGTKCYVKTGERYVTDLLQHIDTTKEKFNNLPIFLLAHSMGGAIGIATAIKRPDLFKGVVLIGPLIEIDPATATPLKIKVFGYVGKLLPYFPVQKIDYSFVTRDPERSAYLEVDPLMNRGYVKAGWGAAMLEMIMDNQKNMNEIEWPFIIIQGEEDKLCSVSGAKLLFEKACSKDKQLKIYEKAYHSVHRDLEETKNEAVEDIVSWITSRI